MNKFRFTIKVLVIATFVLAFASLAQAQATRTWVSGVGDDANPCSRTAPCKTFAGAISKTATGGEINVLDPGGFGGVTITKSITISSEGFEAGVLVSGTNAIIINGASTSVVILRGLDIQGLGTGLNGIRILAAQAVIVENCTISSFRGTGGRGISDERTQTSPLPNLFVSDCFIRDNTIGIGFVGASGGPIIATIDNTRIQDNTSNGLQATNSAVVNVRLCNVARNLGDGILAQSSSQMNVVSTLSASNSGVGANNNGAAHFSLADVSIMNNGTGVSGTMTSFGNNNVRDNGGGNTILNPVGQQ